VILSQPVVSVFTFPDPKGCSCWDVSQIPSLHGRFCRLAFKFIRFYKIASLPPLPPIRSLNYFLPVIGEI
jgi:hypothetical protein